MSDRTPPPPSADRLDRLRDGLRRLRDLTRAAADAEERVRELKRQAQAIEFEELPDLFAQASMRAFVLEAEGNLPAVRGEVRPYYYANIAADWDEARRQEGFAELERLGGADLVKVQVSVAFGRGEQERVEALHGMLQAAKIPYRDALSVPWNTLTAFVREQVEGKRVMPHLEKLGATVGRRATIKPVED